MMIMSRVLHFATTLHHMTSPACLMASSHYSISHDRPVIFANAHPYILGLSNNGRCIRQESRRHFVTLSIAYNIIHLEFIEAVRRSTMMTTASGLFSAQNTSLLSKMNI